MFFYAFKTFFWKDVVKMIDITLGSCTRGFSFNIQLENGIIWGKIHWNGDFGKLFALRVFFKP